MVDLCFQYLGEGGTNSKGTSDRATDNRHMLFVPSRMARPPVRRSVALSNFLEKQPPVVTYSPPSPPVVKSVTQSQIYPYKKWDKFLKFHVV